MNPIKVAAAGIVGALLLGTALGGFYTVSPTEMAGVRRFGAVHVAQPVGPGLHFKLPWIDTVDKLQVSISKFAVKDLKVYTIDNQPITISVSMTYDVPTTSVLHLLYDVGQAGNFDLWTNVEPVIADRAMRVFSQENTVTISEDRSKLAIDIEKSVQTAIEPLFGIHVRDLQITHIGYSPTFEQSIDAAVQAKNRAIQAENTVNQKKYEAEQVKIAAEGQAQAAIAAADGERQSRILKAEGEAKARVLEGEAQAKAVQVVGAAVALNPSVVQYEIATHWNGSLPATMAGGALPLLNLPAKP